MQESTTRIQTVVIGAGHAGLSVSSRLTERSIDHVVLERGEVANSWRSERRESLSLLTPNWQTGLPGMEYCGDDPGGYMAVPEVVEHVTTYAAVISAPVETQTTVTNVCVHGQGYLVESNRGRWICDTVVIASGSSNIANVPALSADVPDSVRQFDALTYRSPEDLDGRAVLVVGASATGVQIADEIQRTGRTVTVATGEHVRVPRDYRGRDVFWWMDQAGVLDEGLDDIDDLTRARHVPSPQLIGTRERRPVDLNALTDSGVEIVGRLMRVGNGAAEFSGSIANVCMLADLKMNRLLQRFDDWAEAAGVTDISPIERFEATRVPAPIRLRLDFEQEDIGTVIWATGYRPDYSWLDVPVLDRKGRIRHDGGVADWPGLYVTGLNLLRRRRSSYIGGAAADSADLVRHLSSYLG